MAPTIVSFLLQLASTDGDECVEYAIATISRLNAAAFEKIASFVVQRNRLADVVRFARVVGPHFETGLSVWDVRDCSFAVLKWLTATYPSAAFPVERFVRFDVDERLCPPVAMKFALLLDHTHASAEDVLAIARRSPVAKFVVDEYAKRWPRDMRLIDAVAKHAWHPGNSDGFRAFVACLDHLTLSDWTAAVFLGKDTWWARRQVRKRLRNVRRAEKKAAEQLIRFPARQ